MVVVDTGRQLLWLKHVLNALIKQHTDSIGLFHLSSTSVVLDTILLEILLKNPQLISTLSTYKPMASFRNDGLQSLIMSILCYDTSFLSKNAIQVHPEYLQLWHKYISKILIEEMGFTPTSHINLISITNMRIIVSNQFYKWLMINILQIRTMTSVVQFGQEYNKYG